MDLIFLWSEVHHPGRVIGRVIRNTVNAGFTNVLYPPAIGRNIHMGKILVVDDDPHIRELVRVFLRNEGFDIVEAADGVDALSQMDTVKVDLAIIDVMMPRMDGWKLCQEIKAASDIPILMLTAK